MRNSNNKEKVPRLRSRQNGPAPLGGTSPARRQAAAILEVLAGVLRPKEAAQALGTSLPRYYQLERRALTGLVSACEPVARGPRAYPARQLAALERENRRLTRERDRQQALVRMAGRSLGLAVPSGAKPSANGKEESTNGSAKRRRKRRASVRALHVARGLRNEDEIAPADSNGTAEPVSTVS